MAQNSAKKSIIIDIFRVKDAFSVNSRKYVHSEKCVKDTIWEVGGQNL